MLVSCILISHQKPRCCSEALASVLGQDGCALEVVVMDSGRLLRDGYFDAWENDRRVAVIPTREDTGHARPCPQSWAINEAFRRQLVTGDLVHYLSDDDVMEPGAYAGFALAARDHPGQCAWYGEALLAELGADDRERDLGRLLARQPSSPGGYCLDCRADGMQICHRSGLRVSWPEDARHGWHADGLFLTALAEVVTIHPLALLVGRHRRTPSSTYTRPEV